MKTMRTLLLCTLIMLTGRVAIADYDHVRTDWDRSAQFYRYKTFMWFQEPQLPNPWINEWIINAVNAELEARGFCLVKGNADLAVSAYTATAIRCNATCNNGMLKAFYAGLAGGWSWYHYWTPAEPAITVVETFDIDSLVVDVAETQTQRVVWWGAGTEAISEQVKHVNKRVEQMFLSFPPGA
jgi:Domain of unknown function (DUF4136)